MTQRVFLTDEFVEATRGSAVGEDRIWDVRLKGFCLRIHPSGRKVYCLKHMVGGRAVWRTIGQHGSPWTAGEARAAAEEVLRAEIDIRAKTALTTRRCGVTVGQLIDRYLTDGPATKLSKRASSWKTDASYLRQHVGPMLGDRHVGDLTQTDVAVMIKAIYDGVAPRDDKTGFRGLARIRGGPGAADRTLDVVAAMFAWAISQRLMSDNPARGLKLPRRPAVERFLSKTEAQKLFLTLASMEASGQLNPVHGAAIRLLLLTGARKSEIVGLSWSELDLTRRRIVLPPERSKSGGSNGERRIPLSQAAIDLLSAQPRLGEHVFPAAKGGSGHFTGLHKSWTNVRDAAELGGMRIHDLRHSFASFAMTNGENIVAIGRALGHADMRTTQRYLHLRDQELTDLAERMGQLLAS